MGVQILTITVIAYLTQIQLVAKQVQREDKETHLPLPENTLR